MKIDRVKFYVEFRKKISRRFTNKQVEGINAILDEWERQKLVDLRWLAYMLATSWHETARTMQPIAEFGKGGKRPYASKIKHSGVRYTTPDKLYYGRGFVQLTWYENYELMGRLLRVNLLREPELAMNMVIAIRVMFEGMLRGSSSFGDFTGRSLEQYFNDKVDDPINARRIINGLDKAELIAQHHYNFLSCLI